MKFLIPCILHFLSISTIGTCQNFWPKFRHFGIEEGLSTSAVTSLCQDKEGKIWIGTHDGLNCFYGTEFKTFHQEEGGLPQSAISDLICDQKGLLWILTYGGGICLMDPITQEFLPLPQSIKKNWIHGNCLAEDPAGNIWLGYYEGLRIYNPTTGKLVEIDKIPGTEEQLAVSEIAFDKSGKAWIATPFQGLFVMNCNETHSFLAHLPFSHFNSEEKGIGFFNKIYSKKEGIVACTQAGIFNFQFKEDKTIHSSILFSEIMEEPKALLIENENIKWVGLSDGKIVTIDKSQKNRQSNSPYFGRYTAGGVSEILRDKMGGIWVGGEEGLDYTHEQLSKFTSFAASPEEKLDAFKIIWGIYTDDDQNFYLGSKTGLYSFNSQTFASEKIPIPGQKGNLSVFSLLKSKSNEIWAGTQKGLVAISGSGKKRKAIRIFPEIQGVIGSMLQLENGDFFAGSYDDRGLYQLKNQASKTIISRFTHEAGNPETICNNSINCLIKGVNGEIWIGTDDGFSAFFPSNQKFSSALWNSKPKELMISPLVYSIVDLPDKIWIGTFGSGIFVIDKKSRKWTRIGKTEGLLNESIYALAQKGDFIWASSNDGLFKIDITTKKVDAFTQGDGLQSNEYNHFAVFQNPKSEKLYFGGIQGFDEVSQVKEPKNELEPMVVLVSARILESDKAAKLSPGKSPWILEPTQRAIELEFAALNYLMPEKNQYAYSFEGEEDNRIQLGTKNKVTLINLKQGNYTLLVYAANNQGIWTKNPLRISFSVKPHFWETIWFKLFVTALLVLLVIWISRLYLKTKLRKQVLIWEKQKAVRLERTRISNEMHDDLGSGLTSIKMLSDLMKLKMGSQSLPELSKIADRSEKLVDSLNTIVWALNDRNDPVKAVIGYLRLYASEQFDGLPIDAKIETKVDIEIEEYSISGEIRRDVFLILKEAINNLIKHSNAKKAWIQIEARKEQFELRIIDNGTKNELQPKLGGNGLLSMKERAKACGGEIQFSMVDGFQVYFKTENYYERVIE